MTTTSTAIERAAELLKAGNAAAGIAVVSRAADEGDAAALHQMGLWRVYGSPLPRDFSQARMLFRRAGEAGHAGAALAHAVFVALGASAPPDWQAALTLLDAAAQTEPIAAQQKVLIEAMKLDPNGRPSEVANVQAISASPPLWRVSALFTPAECNHVIRLSRPLLVPSVVVDPATGMQAPHPIRTSDGTVLGPIQQDLVIHALNLRIAAVTGTQVSQGEPLAVLRYEPGQQYRLHHDCLPQETNQRIATIIVYLNDGYGGGATNFPALDLNIKPRTGDAILFANTLSDGRVDQGSRHAGMPITHGEKWICTRWIRQHRFDPWGMLQTHRA